MTMTMTTNPNCDNSSVMVEISSQRMTADGSNDDNNNDKWWCRCWETWMWDPSSTVGINNPNLDFVEGCLYPKRIPGDSFLSPAGRNFLCSQLHFRISEVQFWIVSNSWKLMVLPDPWSLNSQRLEFQCRVRCSARGSSFWWSSSREAQTVVRIADDNTLRF